VSEQTTATEAHGHTHADVSGGWLRAAVFGAMDGLVSNTALVAGVGGGGVSSHAIVLTGFAGLISGAISMALGEYTSVKTQNEQLDLEVARERAEMERNPRGEVEELAEMIRVRGVDPALADEVAEQLHRDREAALRLHIVAEVGLSPDDKPSPRTAAISSLLTFSTVLWYPAYEHTTAAWGFTPLQDQQLGGLLMWVPSGVVFVLIGLVLFGRWLKESEKRAQLSRVHALSHAPISDQ